MKSFDPLSGYYGTDDGSCCVSVERDQRGTKLTNFQGQSLWLPCASPAEIEDDQLEPFALVFSGIVQVSASVESGECTDRDGGRLRRFVSASIETHECQVDVSNCDFVPLRVHGSEEISGPAVQPIELGWVATLDRVEWIYSRQGHRVLVAIYVIEKE